MTKFMTGIIVCRCILQCFN